MKNLLNLVFVFVLGSSCEENFNANKLVVDSLNSKLHTQNVVPKYKIVRSTSNNKQKIVHVDEVVLGLNKITISTYYLNDTLSEHDAWEAIQWPIVENQTITFQFKDSVCNTIPFSTTLKRRQTKEGKIIKSPQIIIWNSTFIEGNNECFFEIVEASDICTGAYCPTYDGLFRLNGDPIYQMYKDTEKNTTLLLGEKPYRKIIIKENDNFSLDTLYERNGISKEMIKNSWDNRFCVGINCE